MLSFFIQCDWTSHHETEHWLVSADLEKELDALKYDYCAIPLCIYVNDRFVEPVDVNKTIRGALVVVHFELWHFFIAPKSYDSFNATIEQILVLQPGEAPPNTPYKRKNVHNGPIHLNPTPTQWQCFEESHSVTSSSHTRTITERSSAGTKDGTKDSEDNSKDDEDNGKDSEDNGGMYTFFVIKSLLNNSD